MAALGGPTKNQAAQKSGLKKLKTGEKLFLENDHAQSLYIIQKGQIRLYRPKGKGFIELATLRAGEVLGEMAFFDEQGSKRSCSAEAIVESDVIEISFQAFGKAIENLNPWFKSIISSLVDRLKKTNAKVKELETNSLAGGYSGKTAEYRFLQNQDVVRILAGIYLSFKAHGVQKDSLIQMPRSSLKFYLQEIFGILEVRIESVVQILRDLNHLTTIMDEHGSTSVIATTNVSLLRSLVIFFNNQRALTDDKKMEISPKGELILERLLRISQVSFASEEKPKIDIRPIMAEFKAKKVIVELSDLDDSVRHKLIEEVVVGKENELWVVVNKAILTEHFPGIQFLNALNKFNKDKVG